jgi:exodeoxyribonuclease-5
MVTLTSQQQTILEQFLEQFTECMHTPAPSRLLYQISGPAGTGKTELTRHIIERLEDYSIIVCAPTHKAVQVLQERLQECCVLITTCHQFLVGKPTYNSKGESKWKFKTETVEVPDLLIIDEVSMISEDVYKQFEWLLDHRHARVLTLGDRCQLPPVLEQETLFYTHSVQAELSQNMRNEQVRYNNLLNRLRQFICDPKSIPVFTLGQFLEWLAGYTQVYSLQTGSIQLGNIPRSIIRSFQKLNGSTVMLAHRTNSRNNTVQQLNQYIRTYIFKEKAQDTFTEHEQVMFTDYFVTENEQTFYTNDRATVSKMTTCTKAFYAQTFLVYDIELECKRENVHVYYIHKTNAEAFGNYRKQIYQEIEEQVERIEAICKKQCAPRCAVHRKEIDELWKAFHDAKKKVLCPIDYAYCLSIHKSQGSTYDNVYLFLSDFAWMIQTQKVEFLKLLYVGMSRARSQTIIF